MIKEGNNEIDRQDYEEGLARYSNQNTGATLINLTNAHRRNPPNFRMFGVLAAGGAGTLAAALAENESRAEGVSDSGRDDIRQREGVRLQAYRDVGGEWTIGYGHLGAQEGDVISRERAEELFEEDLAEASDAVTRLVNVDLTQDQFDALTSFVYNIGQGAFAESTLLRELNAGNYETAASEFERWNHVNGEINDGLTARRLSERVQFESGGDLHDLEIEQIHHQATPEPFYPRITADANEIAIAVRQGLNVELLAQGGARITPND